MRIGKQVVNLYTCIRRNCFLIVNINRAPGSCAMATCYFIFASRMLLCVERIRYKVHLYENNYDSNIEAVGRSVALSDGN